MQLPGSVTPRQYFRYHSHCVTLRGLAKSVFILIVCYVLTGGAFAYAIPEHVYDPAWPAHARNHVLQALFWIDGFCVVGAIHAMTALPSGQRSDWWIQLTIGIFIYGGYFVAIPLTGGGAPGPKDDIFFGVVAVLHFVGVLTSR